MATSKNHTGIFKKILVEFITKEDPIPAMLEWTAQQMMQTEAETRVGANKGEHSRERKTHFSGTRVRQKPQPGLFKFVTLLLLLYKIYLITLRSFLF
jgi:hypothetical protein